MVKAEPSLYAFSEKIIFSAFCASLCWMAAMAKIELSHAYPFLNLSSVFVLVLSGFFFYEAITLPKLPGVLLIMTDIIVGCQG